MADSENSRTLSFAIGRNVLREARDALIFQSDMRSSTPDGGEGGPVLSAWRIWNDARERTIDLCRRQQAIETELVKRTGGYPTITLFAGTEREVRLMSDCAIDRYLPGDDQREARDRAKAELAEVVRVWDELETELGYRAAMKAEADSDRVADQLAAALYSLRGTSDVDVLAKLHAVIEMENPAPWDLEHPWIRLQNILEDLVGMVKDPASKADM